MSGAGRKRCLAGCCKGHCGGSFTARGCECEGHAPGCPNDKRRKRLNRAAPALLQALRDLDRLYVHAWDLVEPSGAVVFNPDVVRTFERLHAAAQRAIKLASDDVSRVRIRGEPSPAASPTGKGGDHG